MALHAQARQLARHGRIRTRRSRVAMSGSPHRRQANPRPRSHRMAGPPQQASRQSRLAIHNRQRPRQAEETVPSVRVTRATSPARSTFEIVITVVPLVLLWILMWATLDLGYWFCLLLAVPAAGFLVRLFMIQHDCGHGAFFHHRLANDWVGRVIGVLTLTPYDFWRRTHAIHHASSGNLDRRGIGDIRTLTVQEYLAHSRWVGFDIA